LALPSTPRPSSLAILGMPVERAPPRNGDLPLLGDNEELRLSEPRVRLYAGQNLEGEGVLHLTTRQIVWLNGQNPTAGYAMDYPFVTLHAISRDKSAWPEHCLYCQLRTEENDDNEDEPEIPELRFVPADAGHLQQIFAVFSELSAMNPDPADEQAEGNSDLDDDSDDDGQPIMGVGMPPGTGVWSADHNDAAMEDADEDEEDLQAEGDIAMDSETK